MEQLDQESPEYFCHRHVKSKFLMMSKKINVYGAVAQQQCCGCFIDYAGKLTNQEA